MCIRDSQKPGLPVGAVEHGNIGKASDRPTHVRAVGLQHIHAAHHAADLLGDEDALRHPALALDEPDGQPGRHCRHKKPPPAGIVGDKGHGALQDFRCRAVIFLEVYHPRLGIIFQKMGEALAVRPTEAVDSLIRIADDKELLSPFVKSPNQAVLDRVNVLELVHQKVGEGAEQLFLHTSIPDEGEGLPDEVVKFQEAFPVQLFIVGA